MGKRGPLPKSQALKVLSGVLPITKAAAADLGKQFRPPKPPRHLKKEERRIWRLTVKMLAPTRVLENIDVAVLAAYCNSYVMWRKAEEELARVEEVQGVRAMLLSEGANGNDVVNPLISISRKAQSDMVSYATQMGMTPAARVRIQIMPVDRETNPFARLKASNAKGLDTNSQGLRQAVDAETK